MKTKKRNSKQGSLIACDDSAIPVKQAKKARSQKLSKRSNQATAQMPISGFRVLF